MKGLKCTTSNCEYNQGCHCTAGIVTITDKAICKTKIKRKYGIMEQEFANMEAAEEFDYSASEDLLVECDSTLCVHNKNRRCAQDVIDVGDIRMKTKCLTKSVQ